jgi:hypothetical protein
MLSCFCAAIDAHEDLLYYIIRISILRLKSCLLCLTEYMFKLILPARHNYITLILWFLATFYMSKCQKQRKNILQRNTMLLKKKETNYFFYVWQNIISCLLYKKKYWVTNIKIVKTSFLYHIFRITFTHKKNLIKKKKL